MNELHNQIDTLTKKYENNSYVLSRLNNYIMKQLPTSLETAASMYELRNKRKEYLSASCDLFIKEFLACNYYYYINRFDLFINYNGINYKQISEDDVHYYILTLISKNSELQPWKHKLKNNIIKCIKENCIFSSIPESITIQTVLNKLYPNLFYNKNGAKHFLCAIGDSILSKKNNIYIVPITLKNIIQAIEIEYYKYFGLSNILGNFKLKYHDHNYDKMRFFNCRMKSDIHIDIENNILDLLCVACHYSQRYNNADSFINKTQDVKLSKNVFFCKNISVEKVIADFHEDALYECKDSIVKSRDLLFIFKTYLDNHNIPSLIFNDRFKLEIKKYIHYNENTDCYYNISSNYLPVVSSFCIFWNENMNEDIGAPELEIEELITLFNEQYPQFSKMSCDFILDLMRNHKELNEKNILIDNEKYIININCKLWDKTLDVESLLLQIKDLPINNTLYELYLFYTKQKHFKLKMSKKCFEKIAIDLLGKYVKNGIIIEEFWKQN